MPNFQTVEYTQLREVVEKLAAYVEGLQDRSRFYRPRTMYSYRDEIIAEFKNYLETLKKTAKKRAGKF